MNIVEDVEDRNSLIHILSEERFAVRPKAYDPHPLVSWPRKHQLWPCVREGAGEVWLRKRGWLPSARNLRRAFAFVRGHSHEALLTKGQSLIFIYKDVGNEIDEWTGDVEAPFSEIKSTALSSQWMLTLLKKGDIDILSPFSDSKFQNYFEQCCQNCVALGVSTCRLRVFFMNGEYAARRTKCPQCETKMGEMKGIYKECPKCHYKSYAIDLRSYRLTFLPAELAYFDEEVFHVRHDQFFSAKEAKSLAEFRRRAPPTKSFKCQDCPVGQEVRCEFVGKGD